MPKFTCAALAALAAVFGTESHAYYGLYSQEAQMEYEARADLQLSNRPTLVTLNREGHEARTEALEKLHLQILHLMGSLQSKYVHRRYKYKGILGENYEIEFTDVKPGNERGRWIVEYAFRGKAIFDKDLFRDGDRADWDRVPIVMPLQPDRIYDIAKGKKPRNYCMPPRETRREDFWYYWDISLENCPLLRDGKPTEHLFVGKGRLSPLSSTRNTCPQYEKLFSQDVLRIAIFYGYIAHIHKFNNTNYRDENYRNMVEFEDVIERKWGFRKDKRRWKSGFSVNRGRGIAHFHTWEGSTKYKGRTVPIEMQILLSDTDLDSDDPTFHEYLIPALKTANLVIYDGHAGDDRNLNLKSPSLGIDELPQDLYQIFFINGCYTYPYFNGMYFNAKGGAENLELITSGQETGSDVSVRNMVDFLEPFVFAKNYTYQTIIKNLEGPKSKRSERALYGVSGDEGKECR